MPPLRATNWIGSPHCPWLASKKSVGALPSSLVLEVESGLRLPAADIANPANDVAPTTLIASRAVNTVPPRTVNVYRLFVKPFGVARRRTYLCYRPVTIYAKSWFLDGSTGIVTHPIRREESSDSARFSVCLRRFLTQTSGSNTEFGFLVKPAIAAGSNLAPSLSTTLVSFTVPMTKRRGKRSAGHWWKGFGGSRPRSDPDPIFAVAAFSLVDAAFSPVFRYFEVFERIGDFGFF